MSQSLAAVLALILAAQAPGASGPAAPAATPASPPTAPVMAPDRFGLEITHDSHAAAPAFVKLQEENLGVPRPGWLYRLWRSSHPSIGERIDFCNEYRSWERGEAGTYAPLFQPDRAPGGGGQ